MTFSYLQETSFASNQPVTRSLSSVSGSKRVTSGTPGTPSRIPVPVASAGSTRKKDASLEDISPWLVAEAVAKKESSKTRTIQIRTVITTEL